MARASTRTLLSLDRFAQIVQYSPILFNQVEVRTNDLQPGTSCSDPVLQYTWQVLGGGMPGREEIAQAILQAENTIEEALGFAPLPKWYDEPIGVPTLPSPGPYQQSRLLLRTPHKYFIAGGREAWASIALAAPISFEDRDHDGYFETAVVVVSTAVTDADEIAVYYPVSELSEAHDPTWEVRPIFVKLDTTLQQATITFKRHQIVKPELLESLASRAVVGEDNANFLATVDVYRHYNDLSQMGTFEWFGGCTCGSEQCGVSAQSGCLTGIDSRNGIVRAQPGDWDVATKSYKFAYATWCQVPARVRAWYRAGWRDNMLPRPFNNMSQQFERAIAFLALANMDREWEQCENIRDLQKRWRQDLAQRTSTESGSVSFAISQRQLDNPFGTTRAALYAWSVVSPLRVGEAVLGL